ncbi:MAG: ATP-binding cassette domain-containing protein [Actinobacteria bacterium]|nr:ATP-binding cassette domain-containing protein [Actinomycetota bacterium]
MDKASVSIDGGTVLGPISWSVGAGECWVLLGPNGSGKTTLLSLAGARRQPSSGRVAVLGEFLGETGIRELWPRIGHVSHRLAEDISPSLSVEEVVLTGRSASLVTWLEEYGQDDLSEADRLLRESGCGHLARQRFGDCSLGERQRVLVARARFGVPELLLLDEPAAGIDLPGREELVAATQAACEDGSTVVLATHHLEEIPPAATHALLLSEGRVAVSGVIEDVLTSGNLSSCFGLELSVTQDGGRWGARSTRPTSQPVE